MSETTDVVIVGGGVIGCSIAYHLRKAGVTPLVIERQDVAAEASSAAAGLLSPLGALPGSETFTRLILASWSMAPELIPELEAISGVAVEYYRPGSLRLATSTEGVTTLRQRMTAWQSLGIQATWLTGEAITQREPLLSPSVKAAVHAPQEGSIKAPALTRAYAGAAQKLGARFALSTEVIGLRHSGSRVTGIQTARGETISCRHLVLASGAWSSSYGEWLGLSIPVSPMKGQILSLKQPQRPLAHILFGEEVYLIPKQDGTIYVGATVEQAGFDKQVTAGAIAWLLSSAIRLVPELEHTPVVNMWAGLRPWSLDGHPILGKAPGWENVTLATGHSGMGFELSAITGKTIAELITTKHTSELIQPFSIERFQGDDKPL